MAFLFMYIVLNCTMCKYLFYSLGLKLCKLNNTVLRILQFKQFDFPVVKLYENFNTLLLLNLYIQQILIFLAQKFMHHRYKLSLVFNTYFLKKNNKN